MSDNKSKGSNKRDFRGISERAPHGRTTDDGSKIERLGILTKCESTPDIKGLQRNDFLVKKLGLPMFLDIITHKRPDSLAGCRVLVLTSVFEGF